MKSLYSVFTTNTRLFKNLNIFITLIFGSVHCIINKKRRETML